MRIEELPNGGKVELEVKCGGQIMSFPSIIQKTLDNSILISAIKVEEKTIGFSDPCHINFLYKEGGNIFFWENVTVKLVKYDEVIYHQVELDGEGKPYNRREAFRLYIGEDMPLYINTADGPKAITVLVKDISELGVAFITKEDLEVERTFQLKLRDANALLIMDGIIIRKDFLPNLNSYIYGCKFYKHNNRICKYIAKKQCEKLKLKNLPSAIIRNNY